MQFKLTVTYPDGTSGCQWEDLTGMQAELGQLAKVLDALVVGEVVEIKRIS